MQSAEIFGLWKKKVEISFSTFVDEILDSKSGKSKKRMIFDRLWVEKLSHFSQLELN